MSKRYFTLSLLLVISQFSISTRAEVTGRYTDWLHTLVNSQNYKKLIPTGNPDPDLVQLTCLETPGQRFYIGVAQSVLIKAPLEEVTKVVDDIDHYSELFPGFADVKIVSHDQNKLLTSWEQRIPVFFIPNVKYKMVYQVSQPDADRRIYAYQLEQSGTLKESDGFIVLERLPNQATQYIELDFFDANWGVVETFAPGRIWSDSVDGFFLSDLGIKLKAENPSWTHKKAREAADKIKEAIEKTGKKSPGELCADHKTVQWGDRFPGLNRP
jgi:hypothetical protein